MNILNCSCRENCIALSAVASIILGIIAAFLNFTAVIAVTPAFLWVLFGIAVVYLAVLLVTSAVSSGGRNRCFCTILPTLLAAILGTVLLAVILLAVSFAPASVLGAILVGALIAFFSLLLTSTACLVKCLAGCEQVQTCDAA